MRTSQDDCHNQKDGTTSMSCVVENDLIEMKTEMTNETVMVNNCVNIDSNANINIQSDNNNHLSNDDDKIVKYKASEIVEDRTQQGGDKVFNQNTKNESEIDESKQENNDDDINNVNVLSVTIKNENDNDSNNNINNDDDDALTSSKYLDVSSRRCEMSVQPSSSSTLLPHVAHNHYAPTRDNNRNHRQAVRKNFSLWIGVTSCVWACLVLIMKNYAN